VRVIIVEFPWQVKKIIENKDSFKNDIIVSLDAESSYNLKNNKISYYESYEFCNHRKLWSQYKEITDRTIKIAEILDQALWNIDKRFKDLNWKFFNDYHYVLKISFDQLFYYSELILQLIKKFNPTEIIVPETKEILINDYFLIDTKISVIKYLLQTLKGTPIKIKISTFSPDQDEEFTSYSLNNFKVVRKILGVRHYKEFGFFVFKNSIKGKILNFFYRLVFLFSYYTNKPKYLSIGSIEILKYKKIYPKESNFFLSYQHNNFKVQKLISNPVFFKSFMDYLRNETNFYDLIKHDEVSFELIFYEVLLKLTRQLDFLLEEYGKAKKIINRIKPTCVIFQTMTPVNPATVVFRKNCIDNKIPFATWPHGGFGLTYSLLGYDVTDFRLCKNHISYGNYLKDLIKNDKCVLKKLDLYKDHKILPVGSPRFDYEYGRQNSRKILKTNSKRTVLFFMGSMVKKNHFYFGHDRQKCETENWELHHDILCLLKKYQNKYNIIFKDYSNGNKVFWKKILKDIKADKILYISHEHKVKDLLRTSDLNIIPWISTVFFETLYYNADIFAIEDDIFDELLKDDLNNEIFYFKNENSFLFKLDEYLKVGKFYTRNKKNSKNYFLKFDGLNKRDELLNDALSRIN